MVVSEEAAADLVGYLVWATHTVWAMGLVWGRMVGPQAGAYTGAVMAAVWEGSLLLCGALYGWAGSSLRVLF
jgi:hypothetical protein